MRISPLLFVLALAGTLPGQEFDLAVSQIEAVVAPGYNHTPLEVPFTPGSTDLSGISVTSDQSFVTATVDEASATLKLTFQTENLISSDLTATLTLSNATHSELLFVNTSLASLDIVHLLDDPTRPVTYGLHDPANRRGAVVFHDPITDAPQGCVGVGLRPSDMAVSPDGSEMLVICPGDKKLWVIDLVARRVSRTIDLAVFDYHSSSPDRNYRTTSNIAYGAGGILYYTDEAWAPVLRVFDRTTETVVQSMTTASSGTGDFALSPAGDVLVTWAQYGYGAGQAGSHLTRYTVAANGTLTKDQETPNGYPNGLLREPYNTPVHFAPDGASLFVKQYRVNAANISQNLRTFPSDVYSINPSAELAATRTHIIEAETSNPLLALPGNFPVQAITSDSLFFVYFDSTAKRIDTIDLMATIGSEALGIEIAPEDGAIVTSPAELAWSPVVGIDRYAVFLGTDEAEVAAADETSSSYLGEVSGQTWKTLAAALELGTTYYWKVAPISPQGLQPGPVYHFTVADLTVTPPVLRGQTVAVPSEFRLSLDLAAEPAVAWQATATDAWLTIETPSGTTPDTVEVTANPAGLAPGRHEGTVRIVTSEGPLDIPVIFDVAPLNLTHLRSDRSSEIVYAISEAPDDPGAPAAYLLEIDTAAEEILRVVPAGAGVTDFEIHPADNRIYVANWQSGNLLAFDRESLSLARTYGFKGAASTGYGGGDVYRIAAGVAGRLIVEEEDQWVDISLLNTSDGQILSTSYEREGGGATDATGRYYYHGDSNISNASIHRFDLTGDIFSEMKSVRVTSGGYYGSREVVVSEDGARVFWNGSVFNADLVEEWQIGSIIHSTSADGRLAFGAAQAFDVARRAPLLPLPASTTASAFNDISDKLVIQTGAGIGYYEVNPDADPDAPVLVTEWVGGDAVTLAWTTGQLVGSFTLQQRSGETWADVASGISGASMNYEISGLTPKTAYEFRIKAEIGIHSSPWSNIVSLTTTALPPPVPTLYTPGTSTYGQISLSWNVSEFTGTCEIHRARASNPTLFALVAELPSSARGHVDAPVEPGVQYIYKIRSVDGALQSAFSNQRTATARSIVTPAISSATSATYQSVDLRWSGDTLSESSGLVHVVERSLTGSDEWVEVARLRQTRFVDASLPAETSFTYRVSINGTVGSSPPSAPYTIVTQQVPVPETPWQLVVHPGEGLAHHVVWIETPLAEEYVLERQGDESAGWSVIATLPAGTTRHVDADLVEGFQYSYRLTAANGTGASEPSPVFARIATAYLRLVATDFSTTPDPAQLVLSGATRRDLAEAGAGPDFGLLFDRAGPRSLSVRLPFGIDWSGVTVIGRFRAHAPDSGTPESPIWEPLDHDYEHPHAPYAYPYGAVLSPGGAWTNFEFTIYGNSYPDPSGELTTLQVFFQPEHDGPGLDTWAIDDLEVLIPRPPLPARTPYLLLQSNGGFNVFLDWPTTENAFSYRVERSSDSSNWDIIGSVIGQTWFLDETFLAGARYLYRVVAVNPAGEALPSPVALLAPDGTHRFDFAGELLTLAEAATRNDADGFSYLEKFAFGMRVGVVHPAHASDPAVSRLPYVRFDSPSRRLCASFPRRKGLFAPGLSYQVEVGDGPDQWSVLQTTPARDSMDSQWEKVTYQDIRHAGEASRRFMRVVVTEGNSN